MEQNKQKNPRRRLNSLILLVAFTAVMLIVSTYAWFSAQKNVTLSNLTGTVKVVEGLEISLDAKNWSQEVNFANYTPEQLADLVYKVTADTSDDKNHNIVPTELLPVSTTGYEAVGSTEISMLRGTNTQSIKLSGIKATSVLDDDDNPTTAVDNPDIYPGYYAIDFFLKNTNSVSEGTDVLQLNSGSMVNVVSGGDGTTGLQYAPRVAFALYESASEIDVMADYDEIVANTMTSNITDVAIWEPNAYDHVAYIVQNNNKITWLAADKTGYLSTDGQTSGLYTAEEKIPTYALKVGAIGQTITDLYNWSGAASGKTYYAADGQTVETETNGYLQLQKQITLQTDKTSDSDYKIAGGYKDLISADQSSVTNAEKAFYNNSPTTVELKKFELPKNEISRLRMYVWLEGQDVDCINYASHGGGVEVDLGLIKDAGES